MSSSHTIVVALGPTKPEARRSIDAAGVEDVVPNARTLTGSGALTVNGDNLAHDLSDDLILTVVIGTGAGTVAAGDDPRFAGLSPPRVVTKTSGYVAALGDVILCDTSLGGFTITLPDATLSNNGGVSVKKISGDSNPVIVDGHGSDPVDNAPTLTLAAPYVAVTLFCDGVSWWVF